MTTAPRRSKRLARWRGASRVQSLSETAGLGSFIVSGMNRIRDGPDKSGGPSGIVCSAAR